MFSRGKNLLQFDRDNLCMLLDLGLDIHDVDSNGNNVLHVVVAADPNVAILPVLLAEGLQLHERNNKRQTPLDIFESQKNPAPSTGGVYDLLKSHMTTLMTLKSLAAIKVRESEINYQDQLPKILVKFVNRH